ncbi:MAG: hypothetical protein ACYDHD_03605 [Vulcanimicrobiaceae bacterium]
MIHYARLFRRNYAAALPFLLPYALAMLVYLMNALGTYGLATLCPVALMRLSPQQLVQGVLP